jgi:hypothetical protein
MKATKVDHNGSRSISGVVESGSYGINSKVRNVETDNITYEKNKNDAEVLPFYFLFYIPRDTNEGILLLQRTGKHGIVSILKYSLDKYFSDKYRTFKLEINTLVQEEIIIKMLCNGTIKKLRCVKYQAPVDIFDCLDEGHKENSYNMELVLSAHKIPIKEKLRSVLDSWRMSGDKFNVKSLVELRDFNFDYDTVKVDVEIGDSTKTFDLGSLFTTRADYDISDQVILETDEHPTFASMQNISKTYLNDLIKRIYSL